MNFSIFNIFVVCKDAYRTPATFKIDLVASVNANQPLTNFTKN